MAVDPIYDMYLCEYKNVGIVVLVLKTLYECGF